MNKKGTDQTARMRSLPCAFVVCKPRRQVFSRRGPYSLRDDGLEFHFFNVFIMFQSIAMVMGRWSDQLIYGNFEHFSLSFLK